MLVSWEQRPQQFRALFNPAFSAALLCTAVREYDDERTGSGLPRPWQTVLATVDTPEARWDVQRSRPVTILEAGVMGLLYGVLRVVPGGWCLECK
jgi:hypothetical protein